MSVVAIFTLIEDFEGKFWARKSYERRGWDSWIPSQLPLSYIYPPQAMGPFDSKERASEALAYLRDGPKVHERVEIPA